MGKGIYALVAIIRTEGKESRMSDDLISRKALLNEVEYDDKYRLIIPYEKIKNAQTAFDKEKVIEELREMQSHSKLCKNQCGFTSTEYFDYMGAEVAYGTAIESVEKGGIE